jgi:hypothetical protein
MHHRERQRAAIRQQIYPHFLLCGANAGKNSP